MTENTDVKIPYTASQAKRFEVSPDPFSRERIAAVLKAYKALKKEVPFFAGITVFGSLTKGKILDGNKASKTDMDYVVFLDREDYEKHIEDFARRTKGFKLHPMLISDDKEEVRKSGLKRGAELYVMRRASELIKENVKGNVDTGDWNEEGSYFISLEGGKDSLFSSLNTHEEIYEMIKGVGPEQELWLRFASVFFLDVGGGLKKYRQALIHDLESESPDKANHLWGIVNKSMKYWERKDVIPDQIGHSFPATFDEAKKMYG